MPYECVACGWTGSYAGTLDHSINARHDTYETVLTTNEQINTKELPMNPVVLNLFREAICHKYVLWEILSQIETMCIRDGLRVEDTPEISEAAIDDLASRINSPLGAEELTGLIIGRAVFPSIYGALGRICPKRDPLKGLKKKKKRLVASLPKQISLPKGYNPYAPPATPERLIDEADEPDVDIDSEDEYDIREDTL